MNKRREEEGKAGRKSRGKGRQERKSGRKRSGKERGVQNDLSVIFCVGRKVMK